MHFILETALWRLNECNKKHYNKLYMHFHRKLWVPKFTYSACVGSKKPPILLIALFLWTSIVLMICLQWKKDKKKKRSKYSPIGECSQALEWRSEFPLLSFACQLEYVILFSRERSLLIWHSFCNYLHNSWGIYFFHDSQPWNMLLIWVGGHHFGPLLPTVLPGWALIRSHLLNWSMLPAVGLKIQVA